MSNGRCANVITDLAVNWLKLRQTTASNRKVGIVLANYPIRDGRIANGVGYDAPASTIAILKALAGDGYDVHDLPEDGNALIAALTRARAGDGVRFSLSGYREGLWHFATDHSRSGGSQVGQGGK